LVVRGCEMEDIKESKKVLTDYMLELNADIQRAEDWANTGADEEMYFALKTVLDRLEQLEKENEELKHNNKIIETNSLLVIGTNKHLRENSIPKSVIREKIEELNEYYKKEVYPTKEEWADIDITEFYDSQIELLEELLGGSNE